MVEISLTDGLCSVSFDSKSLEGLEIISASPAAMYIKSEQATFASVGLEYVSLREIFTGSELSDKGLKHFLKLLRDIGPAAWNYKGMDSPGQIARGPRRNKTDMDWHYALMADEGSEAICAFCRIDDDHICSVVAAFSQGDELKASKVADLIESIGIKR